jgi:hypothetical protein
MSIKIIQQRDRAKGLSRIGRCPCGEAVVLANFTNTCAGCASDYNTAGQRLAPREHWGEETGETWLDCIEPRGEGEL